MIDALKQNSINNYGMSSSYNYSFTSSKKKNEESIFLEQKLEEISDKQGFLGQAWNGIKELTTLGVSESDCDDMLDKYKNGEISFDEAISYLDEYDSKQKTMSSLLSNIATGVGAIAATVASGGAAGVAWGSALFFKGAAVGSALKTAINAIDRATNDIENDALDAKLIAKDIISGALTGATSAVSSGVSVGIKNGQIGTSIINGAKCGLACGSLSGSTSYLTDVAFGDEEFNFEDLATNTITSAFVSGTVGAVVGAGLYGMNSLGTNEAIQGGMAGFAKNVSQKFNNLGTIAKDSASSSFRKIAGTEFREIINA